MSWKRSLYVVIVCAISWQIFTMEQEGQQILQHANDLMNGEYEIWKVNNYGLWKSKREALKVTNSHELNEIIVNDLMNRLESALNTLSKHKFDVYQQKEALYSYNLLQELAGGERVISWQDISPIGLLQLAFRRQLMGSEKVSAETLASGTVLALLVGFVIHRYSAPAIPPLAPAVLPTR